LWGRWRKKGISLIGYFVDVCVCDLSRKNCLGGVDQNCLKTGSVSRRGSCWWLLLFVEGKQGMALAIIFFLIF